MVFINAVVTKAPQYSYTTPEILRAARSWLTQAPTQYALFERLTEGARIDKRHFAVPIEEVLALRGAADRARIFSEVGGTLLDDVIAAGLQAAARRNDEVATLVFTSCSVPSIPAIDVGSVERLGLPPSLVRVPVFQYGCAGGAVGLGLTRHLGDGSHGVTILASVELCSMVYQHGDLQGGSIVGSALFGDGAACVVLSHAPGPLRLIASQSYLIPGSRELMGYDIFDDGTHLRLDREIPQALIASAPEFIERFLAAQGLTHDDVPWWLFHPGGVKILNKLEEVCNLSREQTRWSWESLRDYGNMSSASILYALEGFLRDKIYAPGDPVMMLGIGPGLTLQANLFECCA